MPSTTQFIFLRAIGPLTHKVMPLKEVCAKCQASGMDDVTNVLATGNFVVRSALPQDKIVKVVRKAIASFGLDNDVFIRSAGELQDCLAANPFPSLVKLRPNHLLVQFFETPPNPELMEAVDNHGGPEKFVLNCREIYMDYVNGIGTSKVHAGWIERKLKQKGTARNWNTLLRLSEL